MPTIDAQRLLNDLSHLRSIGAEGTGVVRPAFSDKDMEARRWLKGQYEAAGLYAEIDGVGNVLGRSKNSGPALLVGSHSDTQPTGGWLDGALGVIYGLETVRALSEDPETNKLAVDAVSWQDEESRFFGCMGSSSFCGKPVPKMGENICDKDGVMLDDILKDAGLVGVKPFRLNHDRYLGFLEAHIEQGPHLEQDGNSIGLVDSIVGLRGKVFTFQGQQNHAGTTMMAVRKDAATTLFKLANAINEEFPKVAGSHSVWTMGRALIHPGAPSIVPGYAELELQFRDISDDVLDAMESVCEKLVKEISRDNGVHIKTAPSRARISPAHMDAGFREHFRHAAEIHAPGKWVEMPSGAFHDAGIVSSVLPSGLMFIPSIGGISHDFTENSHDTDIVRGCAVFADAVASILSSNN